MNRNNITLIFVQLSLIFLCFYVFIYLQFNLGRANAEEFFEVYKGVVSEYPVSVRLPELQEQKASCSAELAASPCRVW